MSDKNAAVVVAQALLAADGDVNIYELVGQTNKAEVVVRAVVSAFELVGAVKVQIGPPDGKRGRAKLVYRVEPEWRERLNKTDADLGLPAATATKAKRIERLIDAVFPREKIL